MIRNLLTCALATCLLAACNHTVTDAESSPSLPPIYPDYIGVTVPATIAPMNFNLLPADSVERVDVLVKGGRAGELHVNGRHAEFPVECWRNLLRQNAGDSLLLTVSVRNRGRWTTYRHFPIYVSRDSMDYGLVYRRIPPDYEVFGRMGIYERRLSDFDEATLLSSTLVPGMCLSCHAFKQTDPHYLSLHIRGSHDGIFIQAPGRREMLDTETDSILSTGVYPYWHPSGDYIAYSVNTAGRWPHVLADGRVEVGDLASDVVVYHTESQQLLLSPLLRQDSVFETFPAFSPDGRTLYFCAAEARPVPADITELRYNLCSISFDPETGTFGERIDTLVNAAAVGRSIAFPRPTYDGRYLMLTLSDYGTFPIWHSEADLYLYSVEDGSLRRLDELNSSATESYHTWSSNSRWCAFGSRRGDGLYTRIYLSHLNADGTFTKPFLLPQENPMEYYDRLMDSYNVPEFVSVPSPVGHRRTERKILSKRRVPVTVRPADTIPD